MSGIAIVVPTIRPESYAGFLKVWSSYFNVYDVSLVNVIDGENPTANLKSVKEIMGKDSDLIYNFNDGVRNLGFAYVAKYLPQTEIIITLDDDTQPYGNTIQDHLNALDMKVPVTWVSTTDKFTRGFPYNLREEAEVVLSHGVWEGVKDWDAPTQLILGNQDVKFFQGVIPKGVYYPMCGMNIAFKKKMLPYMYYAPMGPRVGMDRFADIWCGIESKKVIDKNGWAVVSGYAKVTHERASNVWKNLQKEAKGLELNENYGVDKYFKLYEEQRKRWQEFINESR